MALSKDQIIQVLKEKNYRLTDIRLSVVDILANKDHITLNSLIKQLEKRYDEKVNLMSVYNTIDLLIQEHILFTNTFDGKQIWYEIVENPSVHMICDSCKQIIHFQQKDLSIDTTGIDNIFANHQWEPIHYKIEAHGLCPACQKKPQNHNHFEDDLD